MEYGTKDFKSLEMHETTRVTRNCYVMRVPGGLIYVTVLNENPASTFVPYDFGKSEKKDGET